MSQPANRQALLFETGAIVPAPALPSRTLDDARAVLTGMIAHVAARATGVKEADDEREDPTDAHGT